LVGRLKQFDVDSRSKLIKMWQENNYFIQEEMLLWFNQTG